MKDRREERVRGRHTLADKTTRMKQKEENKSEKIKSEEKKSEKKKSEKKKRVNVTAVLQLVNLANSFEEEGRIRRKENIAARLVRRKRKFDSERNDGQTHSKSGQKFRLFHANCYKRNRPISTSEKKIKQSL